MTSPLVTHNKYHFFRIVRYTYHHGHFKGEFSFAIKVGSPSLPPPCVIRLYKLTLLNTFDRLITMVQRLRKTLDQS